MLRCYNQAAEFWNSKILGKCTYNFCKESTAEMNGNCPSWEPGIAVEFAYSVFLSSLDTRNLSQYHQIYLTKIHQISHHRKAPTDLWCLMLHWFLCCPSWTRPRCKPFVKDPPRQCSPRMSTHVHATCFSLATTTIQSKFKVPESIPLARHSLTTCAFSFQEFLQCWFRKSQV